MIPPTSKLMCAKLEFLPTQFKFTNFFNALNAYNLKQAFGTHFILAMIPSC